MGFEVHQLKLRIVIACVLLGKISQLLMGFQSSCIIIVYVEFERWSMNMVVEILVTLAILAVLYGMVSSTEQVLSSREEHVVIDERMTEHRSRL